MKKRILYKNITKPGIFIVYIVYVLWRKKTKQTNKHTFCNSGLFLSADLLPETESSRDEIVCLHGGDVGVYIRARLTWMFESERREQHVGVTVLDIMSWVGKTGHRVEFHTDYFNIEYLFWTWLTSFKSRHFKLSIHICLMYLRRVFAEIQVVLFTCLWRKVTETEPRQRTHPVYFINFRKAHYFIVIMTIQK